LARSQTWKYTGRHSGRKNHERNKRTGGEKGKNYFNLDSSCAQMGGAVLRCDQSPVDPEREHRDQGKNTRILTIRASNRRRKRARQREKSPNLIRWEEPVYMIAKRKALKGSK